MAKGRGITTVRIAIRGARCGDEPTMGLSLESRSMMNRKMDEGAERQGPQSPSGLRASHLDSEGMDHDLKPPLVPRLGWELALELRVGYQSPPILISPRVSEAWLVLLTIHVGPLLVHIHQHCINGWAHLEAEKALG